MAKVDIFENNMFVNLCCERIGEEHIWCRGCWSVVEHA